MCALCSQGPSFCVMVRIIQKMLILTYSYKVLRGGKCVHSVHPHSFLCDFSSTRRMKEGEENEAMSEEGPTWLETCALLELLEASPPSPFSACILVLHSQPSAVLWFSHLCKTRPTLTTYWVAVRSMRVLSMWSKWLQPKKIQILQLVLRED